MQKILSSAPHIRGTETVQRVMLDVLIALLPACAAAVFFFGIDAFITILLCVGTAVGTEAAVQFFVKKPVTVYDLSAAVTGILLALNLPPVVPFYLPIVGSIFAIAIVKQAFGGLGNNFMNPALAARAFLVISWPVAMTTWFAPGAVDAVATASPLAAMANGGALPSLLDMFTGNIAGSIGETSALALLAGGAYLLIRKVITWHIPVSFIGMVALIALLTGDLGNVPFHLLAGGLMLGAFFMATDYVTSPVSPRAQIIFGLGCGGITMVIRLFGGYPEGVSFSILFMNLLTPLLDKVLARRKFGEVAAK
jgi:electron transport complex protein RnfD